MNKLMTVVAASVCAVSFAAEEAEPEQVLQEEESKLFEASVDIDLNSAYIWRNVVQTDQLVLQPCVSLDFVGLEPFWIGAWYWQNWDLSSDRFDIFRRRLNESDYNLHAGVTAWENEDGMSLELEFGHEWYTYHFGRTRADAASARELYLHGKFANPVVDVYGQVSWMYDDIGECDSGWYYELGFNKEFDLASVVGVEEETLKFGLDWNTSFGDADYAAYLTGTAQAGFIGTTLKAYLAWSVTDWMTLTGTIAYTGLVGDRIRDDYSAEGCKDDKDVLWGGLRLSFAF